MRFVETLSIVLALSMAALAQEARIPDSTTTTSLDQPSPFPDESVLPQWRSTFKIVHNSAAKTRFREYLLPTRSAGPVSDNELINGRKPASPPKLDGADECRITYIGGTPNYECVFTPSGPSASDLQKDFIALTRMMQKTAGASRPQAVDRGLGGC